MTTKEMKLKALTDAATFCWVWTDEAFLDAANAASSRRRKERGDDLTECAGAKTGPAGGNVQEQICHCKNTEPHPALTYSLKEPSRREQRVERLLPECFGPHAVYMRLTKEGKPKLLGRIVANRLAIKLP